MAKVVRRENETLDQMLKRFSTLWQQEGILRELRKREYYRSKGQKRREKKKETERKIWVQKMKAARRNLY